MTGNEFIKTKKCKYLGCVSNYQGECIHEFNQEEIDDIVDVEIFLCYNKNVPLNTCEWCGSKLKMYKQNYDDTKRYYEKIWYCPICGE